MSLVVFCLAIVAGQADFATGQTGNLTFGLNGGSTTFTEVGSHLQAMRFQNTAGNGYLTKLELKFNQTGGSGSVMLGVYSDNSGKPGALLGSGQTLAGNGWVSIGNLSVTLSAGTYYWLAFNLQNSNKVEYQTGQSAGSHVWGNAAYGPLPNTFPSIQYTNSDQYVMRATVNSIMTTYTLTINNASDQLNRRSGSGSITVSPQKAAYNPGETVQLTANPSPGYIFSGWSGGLAGSNSPVTVTMNTSKNISALFIVGSETFGYDSGNTTIIASANTLYWMDIGNTPGLGKLRKVELYVASTNASGKVRGGFYSLTPVSLYADLGEKPVVNGWITWDGLDVTVDQPETRYAISFLMDTPNGVRALDPPVRQCYSVPAIFGPIPIGGANDIPPGGTFNSPEFVVRATVDITYRNCFVTATAGPGGNISPSGTVGTRLPYGYEPASFTITPEPGYAIKDVLVDNVSVGKVNSYIFGETHANHTIFASFIALTTTYTLNLTSGGSGNIFTSPELTNYPSGTVANISAIPDTGCHFVNWSGETSTIANVNSANTTIKMNGNYSVQANFAPNTYVVSVTVNVPTGGNVTGGGNYKAGDIVNVNAFNSHGYIFKNWTEGGNIVSSDASYRFRISANRTILANFAVKPLDSGAGEWLRTGDMNDGRFSFPAILLSNGKVLVAGGGKDIGIVSSAELYDPFTGIWSRAGNVKGSGGQAATLLPNGKVLVSGGAYDSWPESFPDSFLFNPDTNSWARSGNMTVSRTGHTQTLLLNGKVLIAGGYHIEYGIQNCYVTPGVEIYNPATGTYSLAGNMTYARVRHTATLLKNGKVLIAGGGTNLCELYDPAIGTFSPTGNLSLSRSFHTALLLPDGRVLVAGGGHTLVELYDPATGTWSSAGNMRSYHSSATLLLRGEVLLAGNNQPCELYNPKTGVWSIAASLVIPRNSPSAVLLSDGRVLLAGGLNPPDATYQTATAELYYPDIKTDIRYSTTTTLTSSLNLSRVGQSVTFTATVNGAGITPTGNITFRDETTILGAVNIAGGSANFTTNSLAAGNHSITAVYSGDSAHAASTSAMLVQEVKAPQTAVYTIAVSASPANGGVTSGKGTYAAGATVTLNATPNTGFRFVNWTENGTIASTAAVYSFTASGNRTLVANFCVQNPPTAPFSLTAVTTAYNRVNLTWEETSPDENGFIIERSTDADFASILTFTVTADIKFFTDTITAASTTYYYRVKAFNTAGSSPPSHTATAATPAAPAAGGGGVGGGGFAPRPSPTITTVVLAGLTGDTDLKVDNTGKVQNTVRIRGEKGDCWLDIPAGTLMAIGGSPITSLSHSYPASIYKAPSGKIILSTHNFGPNGAAFSPGVTMALSIDQTKLPGGIDISKLTLAYFDGTSWMSINSTADNESSILAATITHFSIFAVLYELPVPSLNITSPGNGANVTAGNVTININVSNFALIGLNGGINAAGQGHVIYYLDMDIPTKPDRPAITAAGTYQLEQMTSAMWTNVQPGTHTLGVQLVNTDNTPLDPPVFAAVSIVVVAPPPPPALPKPAVSITSPNNGTSIQAGNVTAKIAISNFKITEPNGTATLGQGHVIYYLDTDIPTAPGQPAFTAAGTYQVSQNTTADWTNVQPGTHTLGVQLVNTDNTPLDPPIVVTATIIVSAPPTPPPALADPPLNPQVVTANVKVPEPIMVDTPAAANLPPVRSVDNEKPPTLPLVATVVNATAPKEEMVLLPTPTAKPFQETALRPPAENAVPSPSTNRGVIIGAIGALIVAVVLILLRARYRE